MNIEYTSAHEFDANQKHKNEQMTFLKGQIDILGEVLFKGMDKKEAGDNFVRLMKKLKKIRGW